ncbi:MAG TPA: LuxR C-terminal-related transcriptional regulator [Ramlibacter sp.]|nr:LuxR C-terminal-related transcriptional regulator [Ramlibacter sp.]
MSIREAVAATMLDAGQPGAQGIARPRLLERLMLARQQRCVVLTAPAGCGKTSLLLAWRRQLLAAGVDVAWVALGAADDAPDRFFEGLLAGLASADASLVREAAVLAGRGSEADAAEATAIALVRAMGAHRRSLALVFDDAHHLRNAHVLAALQLLLDHGPPNLLCAFASREDLPLALGRLRAHGQVLELGLDDLRFTRDESAQLATSLLGAADARQAQALHERTGGWAAGLKLLCLELRGARGLRSRTAPGVRDAGAFARYLEQEVLARLAPAELAFLVRCAVPEHFDAALCAVLAGASADAGSGANLLARLESQGLFVLPAGPRYPDGWWRLHPLLRDVLLAHVQALPGDQQEALHTTAWHFFAANGRPYDAVHHALAAGAAAAAADLVDNSAARLFARGELRHLVSLVRQLPVAAVQARSGLRLWLAYAQLYERQLDDCDRSIAQLRADLAGASPGERFRLTLLEGLLAVQRDDSSAATALLPELLSAPPDAGAIALCARRNLLTWVYLYRAEFEKARRIQLEEEAPLVEGQPLYGTPFGLLAGRCLAGLSHAVEGQVIQAERIYRDVLYEAERRGPDCADAGTLAAGLLGEVLYELNDIAGAIALLEPRLDVLERVSIPDTAVRVMLALGRARWRAGRPLDTFDGLEQAEEQAERMGLDRMRAYSLLEQLQFRLRQGDLAAARLAMSKIEALDALHAGADSGTLGEIGVVAARARIRLHMHTGELPQALARLEALVDLCRQRGRARRVPFLLLQAAAVERQLGHHEAARAQTREALRLGHRLGLVRTLLDAHEDAVALIRDAAQAPELDAVLRFYAERLEAAARDTAGGGGPPPAPQRPGLDALSPREADIVQLLLQAMPNKKIARVLELSPDTVKWHLKNIYSKLGVSGRDEVVERLR